MKNSLETAIEEYGIQLCRTHPALKGIPRRHSDDQRDAEPNCLIFEAALTGENIPGHYDVDLTVEHRANGKSPKQNILVNSAINECFDTRLGDQSWPALHRTTIETQFRFLRIEEVTGSSPEHTKSLRLRKHAIRFIAALLNPSGAGAGGTSLSVSAAVSRRLTWGHCKTTAITSTTTPPTIQRELQDMWDDGGRCPRIDNEWSEAVDIAHTTGFTKMVLIVGGTMFSVPDAAEYAADAVAIATAHPDALIELGNECNLNGFSAAQYATIAIAAYQAIRSAGLPNIVLLGSVGNSLSTVGGYSMLDWCKQLVLNGCVKAEAFDWANYHIYGNPAVEEPWHHLFTLNTSSESCQTVLGNPLFAITEFGASLSKDCGGSEAVQAEYIGDWMTLFAAQPQFRLGTQYAMADEAPGVGTGYGLRRVDLSHRPSWDIYRQQARLLRR